MNPDELVDVAVTLAASPNRKLGSKRMTAASLLLRQALEAALDNFWLRAVAPMRGVSRRVQLISLEFYLDPTIAKQTVYAWNQLSAICHHHAYDLPPHRTR